MKRIYYAYAIKLLTSVFLWQGMVLVLSLYLLGRLTHVASIIANFGATPVSHTPNFVVGAFLHALHEGQILTILVALLVVGVTAKVSLQIITAVARTSLQPKQI